MTDGKLLNSSYPSEATKNNWIGSCCKSRQVFLRAVGARTEAQEKTTRQGWRHQLHSPPKKSLWEPQATQLLQFQLLLRYKTATLPEKQCHFTSRPLAWCNFGRSVESQVSQVARSRRTHFSKALRFCWMFNGKSTPTQVGTGFIKSQNASYNCSWAFVHLKLHACLSKSLIVLGF